MRGPACRGTPPLAQACAGLVGRAPAPPASKTRRKRLFSPAVPRATGGRPAAQCRTMLPSAPACATPRTRSRASRAAALGFAWAMTVLSAQTRAAAAPDESTLRLSGFTTLAAGRVVGGGHQTLFEGVDCPCFFADWSHAGLYGPRWKLTPESRLGVQADWTPLEAFTLTVQAVLRGQQATGAAIEWAFATIRLGADTQLQVGRKRLPLYFYSDFQDIGHAYPWARVPTNLYGWEIVNYDGASLSTQTQAGDWSVRFNAYVGSAGSHDNALMKMYYGTPVDIHWRSMRGADLEAVRGPLTLRASVHRSRASEVDRLTGEEWIDPARNVHQAWSLAANLDADPWILRTETAGFDRHRYGSYRSRAATVAVGRRVGRWTPLLTLGHYTERYPEADRGENQRWMLWSATLRHEWGPRTAVKLQFDHLANHSAAVYNTRARVLSVSVDSLF